RRGRGFRYRNEPRRVDAVEGQHEGLPNPPEMIWSARSLRIQETWAELVSSPSATILHTSNVRNMEVSFTPGRFDVDGHNRAMISGDNGVMLLVTLSDIGIGKLLFIKFENLVRRIAGLEFSGNRFHPANR